MPGCWTKEHEEILNELAPYTPIENTLVLRHFAEIRKKESNKKMLEKAEESGKKYLKQINS